MFRRSTSQALFAFVLILAAGPAAAICLPTPHYRFVGDTASDAMCTDNDIQSAIDNSSCPTTIVITREHLYTNQALTLNNKELTLTAVGDGVPCGSSPMFCDPTLGPCNNPPPTAPLVALNGGQSNRSVITITGNSNVTLRFLHITGGNLDSSHNGGGIFFGDAGSGGYGSLTLDTVTVDHNTAKLGGGIAMIPGGGSSTSTLTLLPNTLILENTALDSGGGIFVSADARLFALAPQTLIGFNHAPNGSGGGVEVVAPARADIASPGYNGGAVLQFNDAQNGGGIAVFGVGNDTQRATMRAFTTDPANPVQLANNSASNRGGAIYLKGTSQSVDDVTVCAYDFRIHDNIAADGAAVYADATTVFLGKPEGSDFELNPNSQCGDESPSTFGAVPCAAGTPCNQMYGNNAIDGNGQPTGGRVILVAPGSYFFANRLDVRYSAAGAIVASIGDKAGGGFDGLFSVHNCLIADNHVQHAIMDDQGDNNIPVIDSCTLANNTIDSGYVLYAAYGLQLDDSIIDQPGVPTLSYSGSLGSLNASYLMLPDAATFPVQSPNIISEEPTFVDAANGDYHLQATSWGIDFAPASGGSDLDRNPRDVDLPQVPNVFGPRDLGAYERQSLCAADTIFCDGFEMYQ